MMGFIRNASEMLLVGIPCALVLFLVYNDLRLEPLHRELMSLKADLTTGQTQIAEARAVAARPERFEAERARLDVELEDARARLPFFQEADLDCGVRELAREVGLTVLQATSRVTKREDFYEWRDIGIDFSGSEQAIDVFLERVEDGQLKKIVEFDLHETGTGLMTGRMVVRLFFAVHAAVAP